MSALPEDALSREIEKQNRHRGVFMPTDRKAYYETMTVNGFPCLIVREAPNPSKRAILYFFGGGMVIGPDRGDLPVMRKLCRENGIERLKVVYSREIPIAAAQSETAAKREGAYKPRVPGSVAFVPSVAGLIAAGEAVKAIAGVYGNGIDRS